MKYSLLILFVTLLTMSACTTKTGQTTSGSTEANPVSDLLVGTYTGDGSEGIYRLKFDARTGSLADLELVANVSNPSFITKEGEYVYSVSEDEEGMLTAWAWNETNKLSIINQVPSYGKHPCYIDASNGLVSVANYSSGNGGVFKVNQNGGLSKNVSEFQHFGSSKNTERQGDPHAHFAQFAKDGNSLYVVDLGIDQVIKYPVVNGKVGTASTALATEAGDGPRHLVFHPTENWVYIVTELNSMVIAASVDAHSGKFTVIDRKSTLPEGFAEASYCADIHVSGDGKFLYVSNRGHQSIAIFRIESDGTLSMLGTESVHGDWPRNFAISPDGGYLLVANQNSDNITVFKRDVKTGMLKYTGNEVEISHPVCLRF